MFAEVYLAVRFSCGKSLGAKNSGQRWATTFFSGGESDARAAEDSSAGSQTWSTVKRCLVLCNTNKGVNFAVTWVPSYDSYDPYVAEETHTHTQSHQGLNLNSSPKSIISSSFLMVDVQNWMMKKTFRKPPYLMVKTIGFNMFQH